MPLYLKKILSIIILSSLLYVSSGFGAVKISHAQSTGSTVTSCLSALTGSLGLDTLMDTALDAVDSAAKSVASLFGIKVPTENPVKDKTVRAEAKKANIATCLKEVSDRLFRVALVKFKKQLLDRVTDDTIAWINGDNPKYFTDFGKLFTDSANSALGDTLSDVVGSNVCAPLRFSLTAPLYQRQTPFTRQVSCTLDQVVGNIDNFQKDFSAGGWIGFSESLKPQNNPFGAMFLVQQEIQKKQEENDNKLQAQLTTSIGGVKSVEKCTKWVAVLSNMKSIKVPEMLSPQGYDDPNNPPPASLLTPELQKQYTLGGPIVEWQCDNKIITSPSAITNAVTSKAVTQDSDYLVNAADLTSFLSVVFDAAANRLIKSGVEGLKSALITSDSGSGRSPTAYDPNKDKYIIKGANDYKNKTGSQKEKLRQNLLDLIASSTDIIAEASSTLQDIIDLNTDISNTTSTTTGYQLLACETQRFGPQGTCFNTTSTVSLANNRTDQIALEKSNLMNVLVIIEQAKQTIDSLSEDGLISLSASLSDAINSLQSRIISLKTTKLKLQKTQSDFKDALNQCKKTNESYVCKE